ncbi:nitrate reductase subunit alpha [Sulfitobacter mediterraneus]|uniref:nitrate reductase subunit alpha n=1 Tax=Sulfitobacter mediterraneus TaxID=83219 RepID=UPI001931C644|nr:nitrate reductase subunit alpha [Sulfitobacter mediterraneus]MBM1633592.1 nitrate reductase subunit alpha [Sulfitobacter mediterraneus]MBM1641893.1 nitrate reductase subunit alpha [Sulfitobacter mediterraneus]MBM1645456.1 nitrate reductase subunit alpha [Sulfitobacter mediterraneus]MBM1650012.1 nitrate reductase subunit alpha [Sulfitobacter mediterraneus]MBM1653525.1 nitrate reductase subunit alpha [Sulfitobacter mediterraneus]
MSHLLDRLNFLQSKELEKFSNGHGQVTRENRDWEETYRNRWRHDKIVRSTHGVNCTGSCSWKIYVKSGIVTWETQQTDYPRTRAGLPNHEPRGCARGASYSWYLYSANRVKNPLIRGKLLKVWREMRKTMTPIEAWTKLQNDPILRANYVKSRGKGGFVRATWDESTEIIATANAYTAKTYGPDRVFGFSPIPAMSMVSYAAGSRYLSLMGGVCMSFYDWYCDLPPASPMTWGEQTDVPESADWYNAGFLLLWGSNVPQTRTPDAHFYTEARYRGTKSAVICPDYSEAAKFGDVWLAPKQGTDSALAMAMGHVILREYHLDRQAEYFEDYTRKYSDFPMLVKLEEKDGRYVPGRFLRADDLDGKLGEDNNPEWKTVALDRKAGLVAPNGSVGYRWGEDGEWNLEERASGKDTDLMTSLVLEEDHDKIVGVDFPYFGGQSTKNFAQCDFPDVMTHNIPVKTVKTADGDVQVATVFDLFCANYGLDRGLGGDWVTKDFAEDKPYTPAWAERITGVPADKIIAVAREFATNAEKTNGKSMVILGAGLNHWYHMDMNYRGIINMLVMCGCIGQSGGGWSHYVGQEKLRPQTGWQPLAFALDWNRPPRHMNSTSAWYAHTDQWRYETLTADEILSPTAPEGDWNVNLIDYNIRAERMGWLPSAPQLKTNPLEVTKAAKAAGKEIKDYIAEQLKSGDLEMSCEDPDAPENWPRNLFIWRSNLLGSSGKGHEYFLKHLLGTDHGVLGHDLGVEGGQMPSEAKWHEEAPEGKLDLLVCIDFRMSTTAVYSDIVLPTASWYEKNDLNTSDMHPFIHPLQAAVDPAYESKSDWEIFKAIAKKFQEVAPEVLGKETDVVALPILHDTPAEIAQDQVRDWKKGECELIPGKTAPNYVPVERDYTAIYDRFVAVGPLLDKLGNGGKGITWNTEVEVQHLRDLNGEWEDGPAKGCPKLVTDIDATEVILMLAPETNGEVAVKAWEQLGKATGIDHRHLALPKEDEKIRFRDIAAQPRKIISSPTWSGIESEHVCYNAGYTNVHELIPWRTLTGRQQLYQDHLWMRAFGEGFTTYRPPVDLKTINSDVMDDGDSLVLNFITPHQKWGIHSTYSDNLLMLTLNRGGPVVWLSEVDAAKAGIADNDWVEVYNTNGALTARAVVSQRMKDGTLFMYHAQEKIVNTPGSEKTGNRGGIHNSVTRTTLKPTHMIGGYAHQSYGFNYYGTVGSNRDEFVIVRKMRKVDWLDTPAKVEAAE